MSLRINFLQYQLTEGQQTLLQELENFFSSDITCFLLKGYAGTGKTFMMKGLTDYLLAKERNFRISAPTGRAAKVIATKTGRNAYTIHKTIYSNEDLKEYKVSNENGTETYKFYYELKRNEDSVDTVYIIDEASMVSDIYNEQEFFRFGSGHLLRDFIKYVNADHNDHKRKIIFVGDNAQLPPVGMNFSPALNRDYLGGTCNLSTQEYELTEVVRQQLESGILHNATRLRESLRTNTFFNLNVNTNFSDTIDLEYDSFLTEYIHACNNTVDEETIVVAYSNSTVKDYNDRIRQHFFPDQKEIIEGDRIILLNNNYNYPEMELLNGDYGQVKEVSPIVESRGVVLKNKDNSGRVTNMQVDLTFRNVMITFYDKNNQPHDISCKIIEQLLYSQNRELTSDEMKALYVDFKIRHPKLIPGTAEFKRTYKTDPYVNALRVKFGYAVTCHKAQGGEWKNVFLDCKTSMGSYSEGYFRWLYTGITRSSHRLYTMATPRFDTNTQPREVGAHADNKPTTISIDTQFSGELPFTFPEGQPLLKYIYLAVIDCLKDEQITVSSIKSTNYLELFTMTSGTE